MTDFKAERIYFIHPGGFGLAADFFLKRKEPLSEKEAEKYHIDYFMADCRYVKKFLEEYPKYVYLSSTDDAHANGWGMSCDGFEKVKCPKICEVRL